MNNTVRAISGAAVLLAIYANTAQAATDTVLVTGTITEVVTVAITPNSNSFSVTAGTAVTDQDIATITINSNDPQGYDVTLAGTHATSILVNAGATANMAYTVKYNAGTATGVTTTATNVESSTGQTAGAVTRSLTLSIAGAESTGKPAEAYTDTITVEILGK